MYELCMLPDEGGHLVCPSLCTNISGIGPYNGTQGQK